MGDKDLYPPPGTDESITTRGEDYAKANRGKDSIDVDACDGSGRPAGAIKPEGRTGINPGSPRTGTEMPASGSSS